MKLILRFLCLTAVYSTVESRSRLYHSHYPVLNNDHTCFYEYETNSNDLAHHLVSYCIRPRDFNHSADKHCYGTSYQFDELYSMNITIEQLWEWFAPIDLIDDYGQYLSQTEKLVDQNQQIYCNCSNEYSFGKSCEYELSSSDEMKYTISCYILFNCTTYTGFCLDWREINDGMIHCQNGEDEKHFLDMETNECDNTSEYRCRNGLCIPRSFLLDRTFDCPDRFDEQMNAQLVYDHNILCSRNFLTADCEESRMGLNYFSCGNGQYIDMSHVYSLDCSNYRDVSLVKQIFEPYFPHMILDPCNLTMLCLFHVICLFEYCPYGIEHYCQEIFSLNKNNSCPDRFIFPPGPFVYSYVRLVYTYEQPWQIFPDFICWNRSLFQFKHKQSNVKIDGFDCMKAGSQYFDAYVSLRGTGISTGIKLILVIERLFSKFNNEKQYKNLYDCFTSPLEISYYRIMDESYFDCTPWLFPAEDELENDENRNLVCSLPDRYRCRSGRKCIPRIFLGDGEIECSSTDDELLFVDCTAELDCNYIREVNFSEHPLVNYQDLCDSVSILKILMINFESNDTDETDCEMWPCNAAYTHCNGKVERPNACDELSCPVDRKPLCTSDEYPCIHINSTDTISCLSISKFGDKRIDCLFGLDEVTTLLKMSLDYFLNLETNKTNLLMHYFLPCWKYFDIKILPNQICDRQNDCPLNDDELFCYWHYNSTCDNIYEFTCKNGRCISKNRQWCNGQIDCQPDGEDERFCFLLKPYSIYQTHNRRFLSVYKPILFERFNQMDNIREKRSSNFYSNDYCHRGIAILNKFNNQIECLCPSSSYGTYCQWQSERVTISYRLNILNQHVSYTIIFYLVDHLDQILTYEIMNNNLPDKQLIYLNYPRLIINQYEKKYVRIHVYNQTEPTIFSWFYEIQFSAYLPVTRLAILLLFEEPTRNQTSICQKSNPCVHGTCQIYLNTGHTFCRCENDWYGKICDQERSTDLCANLKCNIQYGKCILLNNHSLCLCKPGRIGPKCEVKFDGCSKIECQNNGTCISIDQRTVLYKCLCLSAYFGDVCQYKSAQLNVKIPSNLSTDVIPMISIYFLSFSKYGGALRHRDYYFYQNMNSDAELIVYESNQIYLSSIIIAQVHFNSSSFYGSYYLLVLSNRNRTFLRTEIQEKYYCPHVKQYLNSSLREASWLKQIKFYPFYMKHFQCFHDDIYMCFVDKFGFPDCLIYNHKENICTLKNHCINDGLCLQSKKYGRNQFVCICPHCTLGEFCQIQLTEFSIILDSVLVSLIRTNESIDKQSIVIKILLAFLSMILLVGFISNLLSFIVFRDKNILQIGCGYYLLISSVANQITTVLFVSRVIYLIVSQISIISTNETFLNVSCRLTDFILQISMSFCDWLFVCIACERAISVVQGANFNRKTSLSLVKFIIPSVLILAILTSVHQYFNHQLAEDPKLTLRVWCVIKYSQPWLRTYNICISIFNNFAPFIINFLCAILLVMKLTVHRKRFAKKEKYRKILFDEMKQHKHLFIAPFVMILTKLPFLIFSLSIKCINKEWHSYVALSAYCLSIIPLVTTFFNFILPSNSYMNIFKQKFPCLK